MRLISSEKRRRITSAAAGSTSECSGLDGWMMVAGGVGPIAHRPRESFNQMLNSSSVEATEGRKERRTAADSEQKWGKQIPA